jgi:hypothetical protein
MTRLLSTILLLFAAPLWAQTADHLQCFKIRDASTKASYTADLTPSDTTFPVASGCIVRVPAKLLCVDVQKTIVAGNPPGAPPGLQAQKYLCYKAKCPKVTPTATVQDQFGTHQVTVKGTSLLCAPEPAPTTTTTTTSTTTTTGCANVDTDGDGYFAPPCGNDCDDNNPAVNPGANLTCGVGACQVTVPSCNGNTPNTCTPGTPTTEVCANLIDDDCDGLVDETGCTCFTSGQCPSPPNAVGQCQAGLCTFFCQMGFSDCNNQPGDGCEVNTQTNVNNCSSCGNVCILRPNTISSSCTGGICQMGPCSMGYANCNGAFVDGCEINTTSDPNNCGGCNLVCPVSAPNCVNSACTP